MVNHSTAHLSLRHAHQCSEEARNAARSLAEESEWHGREPRATVGGESHTPEYQYGVQVK
jgi:hypothetical protein